MSAFLKNWPVKVLGGKCLSVWGPDPLPTRVTHCTNTCPCTYSHRKGGGRGIGEPVRRLEGRLLTRGVENNNWLYLQSINSIKHQERHLGFGAFIDIWYMLSKLLFWECSAFVYYLNLVLDRVYQYWYPGYPSPPTAYWELVLSYLYLFSGKRVEGNTCGKMLRMYEYKRR